MADAQALIAPVYMFVGTRGTTGNPTPVFRVLAEGEMVEEDGAPVMRPINS